MKPEDVCWEYFGFPNPGFMPAWKPAEGLMKALAERKSVFTALKDINGIQYRWEPDTTVEVDQIKCLDTLPNGQIWCREFDQKLKSVAERYLNHLKMLATAESSDEAGSDLSDPSEIMWTWKDLLLEAADRKESEIADPGKGDLSPEWNLKWLIQRQKAINLLRYAPFPYAIDYQHGSVHTGEPSSPAEAAAAALSMTFHHATIGYWIQPSSYLCYIYGPDHGWREGSYCCDAAITKKIYAGIIEGIDHGNVYMILKVTGSDGSDDSFAGGGRLSPGMNFLTADSNGVFIEFDETDLTKGVKTPTRDHITSCGWRATQCMAYADYTSKFHFKGD